MAMNKPKHKQINNSHFQNLCDSLNKLFCLEKTDIISNMKCASFDDKNNFSLYDGKIIDMDTVKLDDMTGYFLKYMKQSRNLINFEKPNAVDAICVDKKGEWFFIEFKNCNMKKEDPKKPKSTTLNNSEVSSIRKKMFGSLWLLFTIDSFTNNNLFGDDMTDFARQHITYIAVVSRKKNPDEFRRIHEAAANRYTPPYLGRYVGYYFKDVYMLTENEFAKFIKEFKC